MILSGILPSFNDKSCSGRDKTLFTFSLAFSGDRFISLAISLSKLLLLEVLCNRDIRLSQLKSWKVPVAVPHSCTVTFFSTTSGLRLSPNCLSLRRFRYLMLRFFRILCLLEVFSTSSSLGSRTKSKLLFVLLFSSSAALAPALLLSFPPFAFLVNQTTFSQTRERDFDGLFRVPFTLELESPTTSWKELFSFGSISEIAIYIMILKVLN